MISSIKENENGCDKFVVNDKDEAIVKAFFSKLKKQRKRRSCLMCGNIFDSNGPHNRRCPGCSRLITKERCEFNMPHVYKARCNDLDSFFYDI